jgi:hypothetical protein
VQAESGRTEQVGAKQILKLGSHCGSSRGACDVGAEVVALWARASERRRM